MGVSGRLGSQVPATRPFGPDGGLALSPEHLLEPAGLRQSGAGSRTEQEPWAGSAPKAPCICGRLDLERGLQPRSAGMPRVCGAHEPSRTGSPCPAQGPGAAACPSLLSARCPKQATGGGRKAPPPMQIAPRRSECRLGKGLSPFPFFVSGVSQPPPPAGASHEKRAFPPGPAQPLPATSVASAASGLRDHLKSWRAEPWLLRCEDMVAFAANPLLGRQSGPDGRVSSGGAWGVVLGSLGGGQVESAVSHVHSGDPSPGAPQASAPAPPAVRPGLSRGAHGPHPTRAHEAPRKLLPVAAGQQGCWACGQALGKQEPLTHGHIGAGTQGSSPGDDPHHPPLLGCRLCRRKPTERPRGPERKAGAILRWPDSTCRLGSRLERRPGHRCLQLGCAGPSPRRQPMASRSTPGSRAPPRAWDHAGQSWAGGPGTGC